MLRINKLDILGFKDPSKSRTITFSKHPISIIYGENGCGKTTVLRIIHGLLSQNESILMAEKVKKITINYSMTFGQEESKNKEIEIHLEPNNKENHYYWKEFEQSDLFQTSSILFGVQRGVTSRNIVIDPNIIRNYFTQYPLMRNTLDNRYNISKFSMELTSFINESFRWRQKEPSNGKSFEENHILLDDINITTIEKLLIERFKLAKGVTSERVQKALFDTLALAIKEDPTENNHEEIPNNFSEMLVSNKDRLIEALKASAENQLRDEIIEILISYNHQSVVNETPPGSLLSSLLYKMILELEKEKLILNSINALVDVFNDQISSWKKLKVNQEKAYIDLGGDKIHTLSELSSGERHLLSFLTVFIVEGYKRNFLMIDEPEISLNVKWQKKLLPLLNNLSPDSQIIVASHSPSIANSTTQYLVELKESEN